MRNTLAILAVTAASALSLPAAAHADDQPATGVSTGAYVFVTDYVGSYVVVDSYSIDSYGKG